jgi:hypothetical protein
VLRVPFTIAGDDADGLPILQVDQLAVLQSPGADFWTAEILQDRDDLCRPSRGGPNPVKCLGVRVVRAVGEIQPADVDAGVNELSEDLIAATRRADRRDDLCVPHVCDSLHRS